MKSTNDAYVAEQLVRKNCAITALNHQADVKDDVNGFKSALSVAGVAHSTCRHR